MAGEAAHAVDSEFPNLDPEVVKGYREAPEHVTAEVLDGALVLSRVPLRHSHATSRLLGRLGILFDRGPDDAGGWVLMRRPELHVGVAPDIVVPSLAGWPRAMLSPSFLDDRDGGGIVEPPTWVCEVGSRSDTQGNNRGAKMRIYHREGVVHLWYVEPSLRTLEVFEHTPVGYVLRATFEGDDMVCVVPFEAVEIPLARLWEI